MLICPQKKILFIHIPRTGGTTIKTLFGSNLPCISGNKNSEFDYHESFSLMYIKNDLNRFGSLGDYFVFTFVRNPWTRMYSWYSFLRKINKDFTLTFKDWLLGKHWTYGYYNLKTQYDWIEEKHRNVDFVGRYENFQNDLQKIIDLNNLSFDSNQIFTTHRNPSHTVFDPSVYDMEMQHFMRIEFRKDFDWFGYYDDIERTSELMVSKCLLRF